MPAIATFNLCNFSANIGAKRLARLGALIAGDLAGPDLLAVQEVTGEPLTAPDMPTAASTAYQALIATIIQAGGPSYEFCEVAPRPGHDGGMAGANIRVGLLFNPATVSLPKRGQAGPEDPTGIRLRQGRPELTLNPGRIAPTHPAFTGDPRCHWLPSRKALAVECSLQGRTLFVIICHFKSMRALTQRVAEYAKKQRHAQALVVHAFAANLLACDPSAALVILGDLNDLPGSKTLKLLKGGLFHNVLDDLPRAQAYTRRHGGRPQALDHILLSPTLRYGAAVHIPHHNSDAVPGSGDLASDHDPVLVVLPEWTTAAGLPDVTDWPAETGAAR